MALQIAVAHCLLGGQPLPAALISQEAYIYIQDFRCMLHTKLYWVRGIEPNCLAIMPRPRGGDWLEDEMAAWQKASVTTVVSLLETYEARELELNHQADICNRLGIEFLSYPIPDRGVPASEAQLGEFVRGLYQRLLHGKAIAIHCRAGIGRTGIVAACLLHFLGVSYEDIFPVLSRSRGLSMPDTNAQAAWVERFSRRQPVP